MMTTRDYEMCAEASLTGDPAMMPDRDSPVIDEARKLGADAGQDAASWIFDGNTSRETYRAVLNGIEAGDPMILDAYREPDLSGEFGDPTEATLADELGIEPYSEQSGEACDAWADAAREAFWHELERAARCQLQVREPGYFTCPCCGDAAISADGMDEVCGACTDAGCAQTTDAGGEAGWWDCQRADAGEDE